MKNKCGVAICLKGLEILEANQIKSIYVTSRYPSISKKGKRLYLHRFLMGEIPAGMVVDHIDRDVLNCRLDNLRLVKRSDNVLNSSKIKNTNTRFKGVYQSKETKKFIARIRTGGSRRILGHFDTDVEAARAYDLAAKQIHGSICTTNESLGLYDESVNESSTS